MTVLELFEACSNADLAITSKLDYLDELIKLRQKINANRESADDLADSNKRIKEVEADVAAEVERLCEIKRIASRIIETVPNEKYRAMLERRFLLNEDWYTVAEKIGYTVRHTNRIYNVTMEYLNLRYPDIVLNASGK